MNATGQATKYPHPIQLPKNGEMPFKPAIGAVMLYVDVSATESFDGTITVLSSLPPDITYELRWMRNLKGAVSLCALIVYDQHDPAVAPSGDYLFDLQDLLWAKLPKESVRLRCSSARVAAIAA